MKKIVSGIITLGVLIFIVKSGLAEPIKKVLVWLFTLNFNAPEISVIGQLAAKAGTWIITFSLVGALFDVLGWYNSGVMRIFYYVLSTIISFMLSWLIMLFENYMSIISIAVGVVLLIAIVLIIGISRVQRA